MSRIFGGCASERLALVIGDAGVGKSRLVWESTAASEAAGVTVITGACLPLTESLPLLPITEALRGLSRRGGGRVFSESMARAPGYVGLEIAGLLPELESGVDNEERLRGEGWQRERRFAAVRELLASVARRSPLALVVEDLHWADRTTLDLLTYLVDGGRGSGFAIAVTCRSDDLDRSRAARAWTNAMSAVPGVTELRLKPLSRAESAELVTSLTGDSQLSQSLDALYGRTEGNPFFIEQLVAAELSAEPPSIGDRAPIPLSLAAMLTERTHRTSDSARRVLAALAVAGRPVPESVLCTVCSIGAEALGSALEELSAAALVSSDRRGWYRTRHALLAEAVTADLQPGRRRKLHALFAETLADQNDASLSAEIAAHWSGAARADQELVWAIRAAQFAEGVYAFDEAADQWRRAIRLCEFARVDPTVMRPAQLYIKAIEASQAIGDFEEARRLTEAAADRFRADGDPCDLGVLFTAASIYRLGSSLDAALDAGHEAVRIFSLLPASSDKAAALSRCGVLVLEHTSRRDEAAALLTEALAVARQCDALKPMVGSLLHLSVLEMDSGDACRGRQMLEEAAQLAQNSTDGQLVLWVAVHQTDYDLRAGRLAETIAAGEVALRRVQSLGRGAAFDAMVLAFNICEALIGIGQPTRAAAIIDEFTKRAPSRDDWPAHLIRAEVEAAAGDLDGAWERVCQVRSIVNDSQSEEQTRMQIIEVEQRVTEVSLWRRRPEDVADIVDTIASIAPFLDDGTGRQTGRLLGGAMRVLADRAEQARRSRQQDELTTAWSGGARLVTLLAALPGDPHGTHPDVVTADAESATWTAELARLHAEDTPQHWAVASKSWQALGRPHRQAYCLWRWANSLLAAGRSSEAPDILRRAADAAAEMIPLLTRITDLAGRARISLEEGAAPLPPTARPYGLTVREMSVLSLLAHGNTNREIAATLFISEKTVSVHVSNILRKLDVTSRVQAAMRATREDLVPEPLAP